MFKKTNSMAKTKTADFDGASTNRIVSGTKIKGDVVAEGDIRIDGELTGTLNCQGKLVVGQTGRIDGEITCQNANISGTIDGKFSVSEMLSIQPSGRVTGDISYGKLSVEPGAEIEGQLTIGVKLKGMKNGQQKSLQEKERSA